MWDLFKGRIVNSTIDPHRLYKGMILDIQVKTTISIGVRFFGMVQKAKP